MTTLDERIVAARERYGDVGLDRLVARMRAETVRLRALRTQTGPLDLACALSPDTVRTPALELISEQLELAMTVPRSRLIISIPPQEGKSTLLQRAMVRGLQHRPETRIAMASYALSLAARNGRAVYDLIAQYGTGAVDPDTGQPMVDHLGIGIPRKGRAAASNWHLDGHDGGVYSVGVGGGLTGRPVDLAVIDDPVKDRREADSEIMRDRAHGWYQSVLRTRLAPGASIILVLTRWHEDDLAGRLLADNTEGWREVAIAARALAPDPEAQPPIHPDPLGRAPGEWLQSARQRTEQDWLDTMAALGEGREWYALYQQRPAPPDGGLFRREWFDRFRLTGAVPDLTRVAVCVDPADNTGSGDEAGVLVGGTRPDGTAVVLDDLSGPMTVAQWYRTAILAAIRWQASRIVYERSLSALRKRMRDEWRSIREQARRLRAAGARDGQLDEAALDEVVESFAQDEDDPEERRELRAQLVELLPHVRAILDDLPGAGIPLRPVEARGKKEYRAELITAEFERGRARFYGHHGGLEHQCCAWQPGQSSPDRLDCMVHLVNDLLGSAPAAIGHRPSGGIATRSTGSSTMTRSTGRR